MSNLTASVLFCLYVLGRKNMVWLSYMLGLTGTVRSPLGSHVIIKLAFTENFRSFIFIRAEYDEIAIKHYLFLSFFLSWIMT